MKEVKFEAFSFDLCPSTCWRSCVPPTCRDFTRWSHACSTAARGDAGQVSTQVELFFKARVRLQIGFAPHWKLSALKLLLLTFSMFLEDKKAGWGVQCSGHLTHVSLPCTAPVVSAVLSKKKYENYQHTTTNCKLKWRILQELDF